MPGQMDSWPRGESRALEELSDGSSGDAGGGGDDKSALQLL